MSAFDSSRRRFIASSLLASAHFACPTLLAAAGQQKTPTLGYGPLYPARDETTGLHLLKLPKGFRYKTFGWAGSAMHDGMPTPKAHDGMGIVAQNGDRLTLMRNHEVVDNRGAFSKSIAAYDDAAGGGVTSMIFDAREEALIECKPVLTGTLQNCAGGTTPWGTWLSCEEYVHAPTARSGAGDFDAKRLTRLQKDHGFVFETAPDGKPPKPLTAMGQFRHEAAIVHAASGDVYLTEDRDPQAGFYRFVPEHKTALAKGGRLQILHAEGQPDLRGSFKKGQSWSVEWIDIPDPRQAHSPDTRDGKGVLAQGLRLGGSRFTRLEGCFAHDQAVYFVSTNGGRARQGQVFAYYPEQRRLELIFESKTEDAVYYPDNLCFSPRGGLVLCEDSKRMSQHLWGLTPAGELFAFAENDVVLEKSVYGFRGDYRRAEWAGSCFSPDGKWFFANVYEPGFTVAITGPWREGLI